MSKNLKVKKMVNYYKELINNLESSFDVLDCICNGKLDVSKMKSTDLISMKKIGSDANNILTMKAAMSFVEILKENEFISPEVCMSTTIMHTNPNANGYDVQYDVPKIIAEVKCNIPVNSDSFGAKQKEGIEKDIKNLFEGKGSTNKTKEIKKELGEYYKFFVVMTCESIEKLKRDKIRDCMDKIIKPINDQNIYCGKEILYYEDYKKDLKTNNVYVVFVSID